eukprot:15362308-Alexandrium_andersonii.AAC.1
MDGGGGGMGRGFVEEEKGGSCQWQDPRLLIALAFLTRGQAILASGARAGQMAERAPTGAGA